MFFREWKAAGKDDELFSISFCKASPSCKNGASSCKNNLKTKKSASYGIVASDLKSSTAISADGSGFDLKLSGGEKCSTNASRTYASKITFFCGQYLVSSLLINKSIGRNKMKTISFCTLSALEITSVRQPIKMIGRTQFQPII